jgi:hypothetical protein
MIFCGFSRGAGKSRVVEPGINSVGRISLSDMRIARLPYSASMKKCD